jgi:hypothetical protein
MSNPPIQPPAPTPAPRSQAEIEYERLIEYGKYIFKITYISIGLVIAVGVFVFVGTMKDFKDDVKQTARIEAQKAMSDALDKPQLQETINTAVQTKVGPLVDAEIDKTLGKRITDVNTELTDMVDIASRASFITYNIYDPTSFRFVVDKLYSPNPRVRDLARHVLNEAVDDVEAGIKTENGGVDIGKSGYFFTPGDAKYSMLIINGRDAGLKNLVMAYHDMKKMMNWNVEVFDVKGANQWCQRNKPKCDK